ncbi:MAG: amidophosphoribosyltransferase [Planctomycetaceae bacterium]|nr:amidophosphoribosyltransferase [Planctomycetaceae bacterium]
MCGIAGIVYHGGTGNVADALIRMLFGCQHRGPDSTGLALYNDETDHLILRVFLNADLSQDPGLWPGRRDQITRVLGDHGFGIQDTSQTGAFLRVSGRFDTGADEDIQKLSYAVEEIPGVEIFSSGRHLEVIKDEGTAEELDARYGCRSFHGTHGIGHVRLATESDVNPSTAHPFWAYGFNDVAIVHNGQITNYFKLKRLLEQRGYRFRTENDSEVIAVYLADKMAKGISMEEALAQSLEELDGTFSFLAATAEGLGYAKDPIGAKPMVVCETDELVAVASEEVSLQRLLGDRTSTSFEPLPGTSGTWSRSTEAVSLSAR